MKPFDEKIVKQIGKKILSKKQTIAVAESVTSGYLQFAFSQIPGASGFFQGGITCYNLGQKAKHLQLEPIEAMSSNCVSQPVADRMALEVARKFNSHWSISITGYATPTPESGDQLYCYFAIAFNGRIKKKGKIRRQQERPESIQHHYVSVLLKKLSVIL